MWRVGVLLFFSEHCSQKEKENPSVGCYNSSGRSICIGMNLCHAALCNQVYESRMCSQQAASGWSAEGSTPSCTLEGNTWLQYAGWIVRAQWNTLEVPKKWKSKDKTASRTADGKTRWLRKNWSSNMQDWIASESGILSVLTVNLISKGHFRQHLLHWLKLKIILFSSLGKFTKKTKQTEKQPSNLIRLHAFKKNLSWH